MHAVPGAKERKNHSKLGLLMVGVTIQKPKDALCAVLDLPVLYPPPSADVVTYAFLSLSCCLHANKKD